MRFSLLSLLVAAAAGTAAESLNHTFFNGLLNELTAHHLTTLAEVLNTISNTTAGLTLLDTMSSGKDITLLAPNNVVRPTGRFDIFRCATILRPSISQAWSGVHPAFSNSTVWLNQAREYSVVGRVTPKLGSRVLSSRIRISTDAPLPLSLSPAYQHKFALP